jgi:hypothetical protein
MNAYISITVAAVLFLVSGEVLAIQEVLLPPPPSAENTLK